MSRARRLLDLIQTLRGHRLPVAGAELAAELGVSLRTLYRDIATLRAQGACIEGEAGLGYILRPGFLLPPLTFPPEEIEALVLGARWVVGRADAPLAQAARSALARIKAILPPAGQEAVNGATLLVGPSRADSSATDTALLRRAIRTERKIAIDYQDQRGERSSRTVWPFALGYFDDARVLVAWCELRQAFRHFRTDRIAALAVTDARYPRRRQALLQAWREAEGIAAP